MIFLVKRWDMLVPWRVSNLRHIYYSNSQSEPLPPIFVYPPNPKPQFIQLTGANSWEVGDSPTGGESELNGEGLGGGIDQNPGT